ncbi:monosaccharide-transporting ATPase [Lentzea pudingi]|uniref:Autoinducer 2 import system permease protein LsrC n=1 Tax=Lentzea pudingi TaxID=1789439 RepID=A0ABQ2IUQ3_9PSEU|nr:ABC transporter permease [Lentzea pudingi]GGN28727.1 monosaccharide-transporting ATPase [Lentzea pudingi]
MSDHDLKPPAQTATSRVGSDSASASSTVRGRAIRSAARRLLSVNEFGISAVLVVLVLAIGLYDPVFLEPNVLLTTLRQAAFVAIVAYGMVFLLAMTEFDLSVGGTYAVCFIVCAVMMANDGVNPWLAALISIVLGAGLGALNGVLASLLRIPVIIVTLGTLSAYRGVVTVISDNASVRGLPVDHAFFTGLGDQWLGMPVAAWFVVVLGIVLTIVFTKTRFGAMVRAIGSNRDAAAFSGIPIGRIRLYALMVVGALAGLAGVLNLAYFQGADPTVGAGFELQVIAAAIIGGTAVTGGSGTVPGALIGALVVSVINGGLVFFRVPTTWTNVVTGAVILIAVGMDALIRRRRDAALRLTA